MPFTRKLLFSFCTFVVVSLIYLSVTQRNNEESDKHVKEKKVSRKGNTPNPSQYEHIKNVAVKLEGYIDTKRDFSKLHQYMKDEVKFENMKHIDGIIAEEMEELRKRGIVREQWTTKLGMKNNFSTQPNDRGLVKKDSMLSTKQQSVSALPHGVSGKKESSKSVDQASSDVIISGVTGSVVTSTVEPEVVHTGKSYRYKNPEKEDLEKVKDVDLEAATDPMKKSAVCPTDVFLLVLVISNPESEERRNLIRDTWAHSYVEHLKSLKNGPKPFQGDKKFSQDNIMKTVFVMGQSKKGATVMEKVFEEARLKKDIVFGNLLEDYRNLTLKTRLGLKWAFYECESVYVVKTDDDVFINPVPLIEWLKSLPGESVYTGYCNFNSPVVRSKGNKWYISPEEYSGDVYPGYCLGGGYLMSGDVLGAILKLSYGRKLFPMEDLYVGFLVKEIGVTVNDQRKHFDLIYSGRNNLCDMNELFLAHQVLGTNLVTHIKRAQEALEKC